MSFRNGPASWSRFRVFGEAPAAVDEKMLDRLAKHILKPTPVGAPPEFAAGWCGGRHVLDDQLDHDTCGFGSALLAGVRIDINRVPPELKRAYVAMAESERAAGTETGFLSRAEKRAAKDEAEKRCTEELADGRHTKRKLIPLLWDLKSQTLLATLGGERPQTLVRDLFTSSLDLRVQSRSAGSIAWDLLVDLGLANDLDDAKPSIFTPPPAERSLDGEHRLGPQPETPWAMAGPEPKDFLGNEFMLWLWCVTELEEGLVQTAAGTVAVVIDRVLDLDCAWGVTGRTALRGAAPTRSPEAAKALQYGKWPRRMGLIVAGGDGRQWQLDLQGDRFAVSGATLPEIDEVRSVREIHEQRIERVLELDGLLTALYQTFLRARIGGGWTAHRERIAEWIVRRAASRIAA